jgi:hypothetical protein
MVLAKALFGASAAVVLALGLVHLLYTFRGPKLTPRDPELLARMQAGYPVLTRQTTMWKAWVGFNASHSLGAILFGLVYGYLALVHADLLFHSAFLLAVGFGLLVSYAALGRAYWFSVPYRGIVIALFLYLAAVVAALTG